MTLEEKVEEYLKDEADCYIVMSSTGLLGSDKIEAVCRTEKGLTEALRKEEENESKTINVHSWNFDDPPSPLMQRIISKILS